MNPSHKQPISAQRLASSHYENFAVLSPLLSADQRRDFATIYAFCRGLDDAADRPGVADETDEQAAVRREDALAELGAWRRALDAIYSNSADDANDARNASASPDRHDSTHATPNLNNLADATPTAPPDLWPRLAELARRTQLPREPLDDLIDAFERDQRQTVYDTWDDLLSYCRKSADPVGRLVLHLGGADPRDHANAELVAHSDRVCTALQLVNHWQDVRKDALELGRVYLPREEAGFELDELRAMAKRPDDAAARVRFIKALRPLVGRTRDLFEQSAELPTLLHQRPPGEGKSVAGPVWLFRRGGLAAVRSVERVGCATLWKRARVGKLTRTRLLLEASLRFRRG